MGYNNLVKRDYVDEYGIQRRVLVPDGEHNLAEGVPISLAVDSLFSQSPLEYRKALMVELWARGLIEPCDFSKAGAAELVRAALLAVTKHDTLDILSFAREAKKDCRNG